MTIIEATKKEKKISATKCPDNWSPGCSCSIQTLEPNDNCHIHGYPDGRQCPYCGYFRGYKKCKRCGCACYIPTKEGLL